MRLPGLTAEASLYQSSGRYHKTRSAGAGDAFVNNSVAPTMLSVTTDDCLGKGLCAYVDTKGHVTCGRCPGQARASNFAAGSFAAFGQVG
jgi:hypothetical protein